MEKKERKKQERKITSKQIVAIVGVILLILLYVATLITAFIDNSDSANWFRISLFATLAIPLIIWIYAWMYARLTGKKSIGDPESPSQEIETASIRENTTDH